MIWSFMICTPRIVVLREGDKWRVERTLHNEELHDLHSTYFGESEGANRGMEKTA